MLRPNHATVPKVIKSSYSSTPELLAFTSGLLPRRTIGGLIHSVQYKLYASIWTGLGNLETVNSFLHLGPLLIEKKPLSHWIMEAIILAYKSCGFLPLVSAHYTRGKATLWALFKGSSVNGICAAVSWASPHSIYLVLTH